MDQTYNNKKYLQTVNAADYYRASTLRPSGNEYTCGSYQNSMSRRSLFGAYSHHQPNMSKYSYPSDVSLSSHYGYTSWGLWRDTGHLSPSSKKRINIRSFSILIMSASFIVLLAVLSVASLAYYFSTFKSDSNDSTLVFDCLFRIAKGDVYSSGLKFNYTAIYRQKAAFYTKFIETSLEHGDFNVAKTEINGFGAGPEVLLDFRVYLDMRKIQMTITNVEEHIKNAFISETALSDSNFRHLKIDYDTIEIKRQLDPEILRQAAYSQDEDLLTTNMVLPTTVIPLDDLMSSRKHSMSTEKTKSKLSTATSKYTNSKRKSDIQKPIHESDIDMENLPVIHGSFEITKTDADISQKRTASTNTMKPFFITPASSIKIKSAENQSTPTPVTEKILEMFLQHQKHQIYPKIKEAPVTAKIEKTNKNGETTVAKTQTSTLVSLKSTESVVTSTSSPSLSTTVNDETPQDFAESPINSDLPKLDASLFTSAPVLDSEPWRPINPSPSQIKANFPAQPTQKADLTSTESPDILRSPFNPNPQEKVMYRNKFVDPTYPVNETNDSVFYQSFYNPDFSHGDLAIEKLGVSDVKPYPLPVNKIDLSDNQNNPDFESALAKDQTDGIKMNYDESKFEHLGAGVIAKKPEANDTKSLTVAVQKLNDTLESIHDNEPEDRVKQDITEPPKNLGDIFQDLLELDESSDVLSLNKTDDNKLESRVATEDSLEDLSAEIIPTTTERLNFMNMKDFIVQMQKNKSDEDFSPTESSTEKPTTTFVEVETLKYTPAAVSTTQTTVSQPQLFPMISKWEFVNGTQVNTSDSNMTKKVFNQTLQAVIVENSQAASPAAIVNRFDDLKPNRTVDKTNLQQLSSIFDTLASRLGIKPVDAASKMPPFSQQNKLKNNSSRPRASTTTKKPKISSTTSINKLSTASELSKTNATTRTKTASDQVVTAQATTSESTRVTNFMESSSESVIGQAEVEPVDPTQYEEILSLISSSPVTRFISTTPSSLVTLMPVKSHSGIRNFNPRIKLPSRIEADHTKKLETVVKASVSFDF